ncbi:MAG: urease accessory protein [Methylophilaceae bacterium]|jgi:urease accessory protein|tara:strand:- start:5146 stop:5712 length:567 start_codon:yes stop_codon:yes gene_type:complete
MGKKIASGSLLALCSTLAFAHPGDALTSTAAGFIHPFTGWDHFLMLLAFGVWSAKSLGKASVGLQITFMLTLAFGASLGFIGLSFLGVEMAVAISVIAMGLLVTVKPPKSAIVRVSIVATIAMLHGLAHGVELSSQHYVSVMIGMLLATALISGIGYWVGSHRNQLVYWVNKGLALLMLGVGIMLLMV